VTISAIILSFYGNFKTNGNIMVSSLIIVMLNSTCAESFTMRHIAYY